MKRAGFLCLIFLILNIEFSVIIGQFTTTTRYANTTTTRYSNYTTSTTRYQPTTTTTRYQSTTTTRFVANTTTTTRYQPTTTTTRYQPTTTTTRNQPTTTRPIVTTTTIPPTIVPASIRCDYFSTLTIYACDLQISNPNGQEFAAIPGTHLPQKFDSDVVKVSAKFQNTRNIPSIICRKFTNLKTLEIIWSEASVLTSDSFRNCYALETLDLKGNILPKIPNDAFGLLQRLSVINFERNRIEMVENAAFSGLNLYEIYLGYNELRSVSSSWFNRNIRNLKILSVPGNRLRTVVRADDGIFNGLESLDMSMNPIRSIQITDFGSMLNLGALKLDNCEITELYAGNFGSLVMLKSLSINNNLFSAFPIGLFSNHQYLTDVSAAGNKITSIDSRSFGNTMLRLRSLYVQNNQLDSIDPEFFNNTSVLSSLFLDGNVCNSRNFFVDASNREVVRREIEVCLRNFRYVRCQYSGSPDFICRMSVRNLVGKDDFEVIECQHPSGSNNNNIRIVNIINGTSTIFPSVICRHFTDLQEITASGNGIISLTTAAFQNCRNLRILQLISQDISVVPENVFGNLVNLQTLSLTMNKIQFIAARSLAGLGSSMQNLYLNSNLINRIENGALNGLTNLARMQLNSNALTTINSLSFGASLRNLVEFSANYNQINGTDPVWFNNSTLLDTLNLTGNICVNSSFINVRNTRSYVSSQLQNCFNRFRP